MKKKYLHLGILLLLGFLIIADRVLWASVSQWREDQATNLWLGYTQNLWNIPVGLISSLGIPNPNGMVILGLFFSRLPNLWFASSFLGCLQCILIIWLCWGLFPNSKTNFLLATIPLLTSIQLRATSVEFWNQWLMTLPNLLFFIWVNTYLANPKLWKIPFWVFLLCLAPSIYLAGIVNSCAIGILGGLVIISRPPMDWKTSWLKPTLISSIILASSLILTWIPYFRVVAPQTFLNFHIDVPFNVFQKLQLAVGSILSFPAYAIYQWADINSISIIQFNQQIISRPAYLLTLIACLTYLAEAVLALFFLLQGTFFYRPWQMESTEFKASLNPDIARPVLFSFLFIILGYSISPLIGGPVWAGAQRPDQCIQFLPLFLLFSFLAPFVYKLPPEMERRRARFIYPLVGVYALASALGGLLIVKSHQDYQGNILSSADVPLIQKMQVVDFIAADWKAISDNPEIPVDFSLDGGIWTWVPQFGQQLETWYPAPMTLGRSFDFDLLRRYGLRNVQEGTQLRTIGTGRYLINYAFESPPAISATVSSHSYIIGRLRVTVVDR
jgi:hypothetical protein